MNKNVTVKCTEIAIAVLNLNLTTAYLKTQLAIDGLLLLRVCVSDFFVSSKKSPM